MWSGNHPQGEKGQPDRIDGKNPGDHDEGRKPLLLLESWGKDIITPQEDLKKRREGRIKKNWWTDRWWFDFPPRRGKGLCQNGRSAGREGKRVSSIRFSSIKRIQVGQVTVNQRRRRATPKKIRLWVGTLGTFFLTGLRG